MKNTNTFKVQFFDGRKNVKTWKEIPTLQKVATLDEAMAFANAQREMCGGMVDFRVVEEVTL